LRATPIATWPNISILALPSAGIIQNKKVGGFNKNYFSPALGLLGTWALGHFSSLGSWALGLLALGLLGTRALGLMGPWAQKCWISYFYNRLQCLGSWTIGTWAVGILVSWALGILVCWALVLF
jgi:hypothetical protein